MLTTCSFFVYKIVTRACVSVLWKEYFPWFPWFTRSDQNRWVKLCFPEFYKLIDFKTNLFIGVQRIQSHGDVFHEKSVLKHIRSGIMFKNPEKFLRRRLVLINFTEKLTLSQILLKVFDHKQGTPTLYTSYITPVEQVSGPCEL